MYVGFATNDLVLELIIYFINYKFLTGCEIINDTFRYWFFAVVGFSWLKMCRNYKYDAHSEQNSFYTEDPSDFGYYYYVDYFRNKTSVIYPPKHFPRSNHTIDNTAIYSWLKNANLEEQRLYPAQKSSNSKSSKEKN